MLKVSVSAIALAAATCISVASATPPAYPMKGQVSADAPNQVKAKSNAFWWPNKLDLTVLRQNGVSHDPQGDGFDYAAAFAQIDLEELKADIADVMTSSQPWWPADYGHYGPFFIRMAWHSAGTYRTADGRGGAAAGQQRFEPLNSWPDNGNLDKAQRLLWPIKQKYGRAISWADLMVLTGNVAMESMGFKTLGFAGGRIDAWEPDLVYWGPEAEWLGDKRYSGERELDNPLAAVQMGLIYVNPEGPNGKPDPIAAAQDIRTTFGRMAMNDEETVALIAGGHTFGKAHGAHAPDDCVGPEPAGAAIENQGLGWKNTCGKGNAEDTVTSGLEGAWTASPVMWTTMYLDNLFENEWVQTKSPAGATQWIPKNAADQKNVPDAHVDDKYHAPIMFTTDLSLKFDPSYREISQRFRKNPEEFEKAFARAWFKLTHRDMGPRARYLGADVPQDALMWQDPIPAQDGPTLTDRDVRKLKKAVLDTKLTVPELVRTAWASASTYRDTDMRGGANGARLRLAPQNGWAANGPEELSKVLATLEGVQADFNEGSRRDVSLADLIVIAGAAAIEKAADAAGHEVTVPVIPGRGDATAEMTDTASFDVLEPKADGFRNYLADGVNPKYTAALMVDKADTLGLTVGEMTALVGGMRALDANTGGAKHGVLTQTPGTLNNAFFVNLLSMDTAWKKSDTKGVYNGYKRGTDELMWTATDADLIFGSNAELRAVAESYAYDGAEDAFVADFIAAWTKVMQADRFDLAGTENGSAR